MYHILHTIDDNKETNLNMDIVMDYRFINLSNGLIAKLLMLTLLVIILILWSIFSKH
jgi:hypothetical protein